MRFRTLLAGAVVVLTGLTFTPSLARAQSQSEILYGGVGAFKRGDYATAMRVLKPLAEQGVELAQYTLGLMHAEGLGVPQDYGAAVPWYRRSAEQGNANTQFSLGIMYGNGHGVPRDFVLAHMWANLAAAQGDKEAAKYRDFVTKHMTPAQIAVNRRGKLTP